MKSLPEFFTSPNRKKIECLIVSNLNTSVELCCTCLPNWNEIDKFCCKYYLSNRIKVSHILVIFSHILVTLSHILVKLMTNFTCYNIGILSKYRTFLSHYRTLLSKYRTFLSHYRTFLSKYRTFLSHYRTFLSHYRTYLSNRWQCL